MWASQNFSFKSLVYSCTVSSLSGGSECSKSIGQTASSLSTSEKWVSSVDMWTVLLYMNCTYGRIDSHSFGFSEQYLLITSAGTLLWRSTCPFLLLCMPRIGGSKPQNQFINECVCHICHCYCWERDIDNVFWKIIKYYQDAFVSRISVKRYWSQYIRSHFREPYSYCDWMHLGFHISACSWSGCTWFATFDPFINVPSHHEPSDRCRILSIILWHVMQSALLLLWNCAVDWVRCALQPVVQR